MNTNLNNLSSKSRRRARLIRLLLQLGHVITRKCLYTVIEESKCSISAYRLRAQNLRPHFPQRYGLIQANLSSLSRKFRRRDRLITVLLQLRHSMMVIVQYSHSLNQAPGSPDFLSQVSQIDGAVYPPSPIHHRISYPVAEKNINKVKKFQTAVPACARELS